MKIQNVMSVLFVITLAGCGYQTDEEVLNEAVNLYSSTAGKYHALLNSHDNNAVVKNCQRFGRDYRTNSFWYNASLDIAEIAPLHRCIYVVHDDSQEVNHMMRKLERRMLNNASIYQKFVSLLDNLHYAVKVVKDTDFYLEEARVLEQRRLEQERLDEARRQRYAMETIAIQASRPVVVEKTTVVSRKPASSCGCQEELAEITVQ